MKTKVFLGLPTMAHVNTFTMLAILTWMSRSVQGGLFNMSIFPTICVQPVDNARNTIVEEFLKGDATHLFFVDADTVPPPDALEKMLAHDKDIVTALTPIVEMDEKEEYYRRWNVIDFSDQHVQPKQGLVKAKAAGSSCILIKRKVFEKMEKPYYRFEWAKTEKGVDKMVSEDIRFTAIATSLGFEMWCDTDIVCKHYKSAMF